mmetsp:Transcript_9936/g.32978  ORF Transcript_9936/g.32978 Transcript_9936/m.32978 type:complete len:594 (-) Transcript_9936:68-1849(-)
MGGVGACGRPRGDAARRGERGGVRGGEARTDRQSASAHARTARHRPQHACGGGGATRPAAAAEGQARAERPLRHPRRARCAERPLRRHDRRRRRGVAAGARQGRQLVRRAWVGSTAGGTARHAAAGRARHRRLRLRPRASALHAHRRARPAACRPVGTAAAVGEPWRAVAVGKLRTRHRTVRRERDAVAATDARIRGAAQGPARLAWRRLRRRLPDRRGCRGHRALPRERRRRRPFARGASAAPSDDGHARAPLPSRRQPRSSRVGADRRRCRAQPGAPDRARCARHCPRERAGGAVVRVAGRRLARYRWAHRGGHDDGKGGLAAQVSPTCDGARVPRVALLRPAVCDRRGGRARAHVPPRRLLPDGDAAAARRLRHRARAVHRRDRQLGAARCARAAARAYPRVHRHQPRRVVHAAPRRRVRGRRARRRRRGRLPGNGPRGGGRALPRTDARWRAQAAASGPRDAAGGRARAARAPRSRRGQRDRQRACECRQLLGAAVPRLRLSATGTAGSGATGVQQLHTGGAGRGPETRYEQLRLDRGATYQSATHAEVQGRDRTREGGTVIARSRARSLLRVISTRLCQKAHISLSVC